MKTYLKNTLFYIKWIKAALKWRYGEWTGMCICWHRHDCPNSDIGIAEWAEQTSDCIKQTVTI